MSDKIKAQISKDVVGGVPGLVNLSTLPIIKDIHGAIDRSDGVRIGRYKAYRLREEFDKLFGNANKKAFYPSPVKPMAKDMKRLREGKYTVSEVNPAFLAELVSSDRGPVKLPTARQYFDTLYKDVGGLKGLNEMRNTSAYYDDEDEAHDRDSALKAWDSIVQSYMQDTLGAVAAKTSDPIEKDALLDDMESYRKVYRHPTGSYNPNDIKHVGLEGRSSLSTSTPVFGSYGGDGVTLYPKMLKRFNKPPASTMHHEYMHALQDSDYRKSAVRGTNSTSLMRRLDQITNSYTDNTGDDVPYQGKPVEIEANLSAVRADYGKPIINRKDAREFLNWVDANADALQRRHGTSKNNPIIDYLNLKPSGLTERMAGAEKAAMEKILDNFSPSNPIRKFIDSKVFNQVEAQRQQREQLRKKLEDVMQLIVKNQDTNKEQFYA